MKRILAVTFATTLGFAAVAQAAVFTGTNAPDKFDRHPVSGLDLG